MSTRSRRWTWTLNNYSEEQLAALTATVIAPPLTYICFGKEIGAEGTPHLQGYCEFKNPKTMSGVKRFLAIDSLHLEKSKGTSTQNRTYCRKEHDFFEIGEISPGQGARSDLDDIRDLIVDGATDLEIAAQHFGQWVRYRASFNQYRTLLNVPQTTVSFALDTFPQTWQDTIFDWTKTQIFWGASGIGKTEFACAVLPGALMVSHMDDLLNFDPSIHSGIIFDDVSIDHFPRSAQIHIVDQTQTRSIHCRYRAAIIPSHTKKIFTTNEHNGACMLISDNAIRRRISIHHYV